MPPTLEVLSVSIVTQAEREMAAFLRATTDSAGHTLPRATDAWIRAIESLDWPEANHEKFFRSVTILAISHLC